MGKIIEKNDKEKNKKVKRISLGRAILITIVILVVVFGIIFIIIYKHPSCTTYEGLTSTTTIYQNTTKVAPAYSNTKYSVSLIMPDIRDSLIGGDNIFVTSNKDLNQQLYKCIGKDLSTVYQDEDKKISINDYFNNEFFQKNNLAIIYKYNNGSSYRMYSISSVVRNNTVATINIKDEGGGSGVFAPSIDIWCISLDKEIKSVNFKFFYITEMPELDYGIILMTVMIITIIVLMVVTVIVSIHNKKIDSKNILQPKARKQNKIKNIIIIIIILVFIAVAIYFANVLSEESRVPDISDKPIIYLYPTEETRVSVNLKYADKITCSYPQYITGWNVLAEPNGDLIDLDNGRNLYSLYYESKNTINFNIKKDGFIVKGTEVAKFLEEKLSILGLSERESEEFIVYWLPKLQENKYNYVRFATMEEINSNMPLEFSTEPDSIIRVLMTYKGINSPIEVEEQQLEIPKREGFVAVEWGGTEIK